MRKLILLFALCIATQASFSQYDPGKVDKKALSLYDQAMQRAESGNLTNAAGFLLQCIEIDKDYVDAYLSLAGVYGQMKNYRASTDYYERAFAKDSGYTIEYKLPYSINLAGMGNFEKALDAINELLDKKPPRNSTSFKAAEYRKRCFQFAVDYAKKHPAGDYLFTPANMGNEINSVE